MLAPSLATGVVAYLLFVLVGGAVYGLGRGDASAILAYVLDHAATPFALAAGVLAAVVQLVFLLLLARRDAGGGTPHWGWEGDERE
jgi:hypothetical protein